MCPVDCHLGCLCLEPSSPIGAHGVLMVEPLEEHLGGCYLRGWLGGDTPSHERTESTALHPIKESCSCSLGENRETAQSLTVPLLMYFLT